MSTLKAIEAVLAAYKIDSAMLTRSQIAALEHNRRKQKQILSPTRQITLHAAHVVAYLLHMQREYKS